MEGGSDWRDQIEEQSKLDEEKTRRMEEGATCQNRFQQTRVQVYARYAMTSLLWWRAPRVRTGSSRPEYMYTPGTVHYDLFVIEEVTPRVRTSSSRPEYRCTPGTL